MTEDLRLIFMGGNFFGGKQKKRKKNQNTNCFPYIYFTKQRHT